MPNPLRQALAEKSAESLRVRKKPEWLKILQGIALVPVFFGGFALLNYIQGGAGSEPQNPQFACLSRWDGSMFDLAWEVKQNIRDPDSFEHIQSYATPVDANGWQHIRMKFRARNGFGGMTIEMAEGVVTNPGCDLVSWSML